MLSTNVSVVVMECLFHFGAIRKVAINLDLLKKNLDLPKLAAYHVVMQETCTYGLLVIP